MSYFHCPLGKQYILLPYGMLWYINMAYLLINMLSQSVYVNVIFLSGFYSHLFSSLFLRPPSSPSSSLTPSLQCHNVLGEMEDDIIQVFSEGLTEKEMEEELCYLMGGKRQFLNSQLNLKVLPHSLCAHGLCNVIF